MSFEILWQRVRRSSGLKNISVGTFATQTSDTVVCYKKIVLFLKMLCGCVYMQKLPLKPHCQPVTASQSKWTLLSRTNPFCYIFLLLVCPICLQVCYSLYVQSSPLFLRFYKLDFGRGGQSSFVHMAWGVRADEKVISQLYRTQQFHPFFLALFSKYKILFMTDPCLDISYYLYHDIVLPDYNLDFTMI